MRIIIKCIYFDDRREYSLTKLGQAVNKLVAVQQNSLEFVMRLLEEQTTKSRAQDIYNLNYEQLEKAVLSENFPQVKMTAYYILLLYSRNRSLSVSDYLRLFSQCVNISQSAAPFSANHSQGFKYCTFISQIQEKCIPKISFSSEEEFLKFLKMLQSLPK